MKKEKYIQNDELVKLIRVFLIIVVVFFAFYALTVVISNKKSESGVINKEPATIQYTSILLGSILNRKENVYYVLASMKDDENISGYNDLISTYEKKENSNKIYYVDMSDGMNSSYIGNQENISNNLSELILKDTTLFKIENGNITEHYSNKDDITKVLEEISK